LKENSGRRVFQRVYNEIKETKLFTEKHRLQLKNAFGTRFENAYKAIMEGKVRKYVFNSRKKEIWVVVGKEGVYQVLPNANFCSCNDFYFKVIGHEVYLCYHLIAQKLAELLDKCVVISSNDDGGYESLMIKLRKVPANKRTLPAEEVEDVRRVIYGILSEEKCLSITQLLEEIRKEGFKKLTTRHLSSILSTDKRKRFQCRKGIWSLYKNT